MGSVGLSVGEPTVQEQARLQVAREENARLRKRLEDKDREVFLLKEKLYEAINAKKLAVAQQQQQQQQGVEGTADAAGQQRRGKPVKGARGGPGKTPLGISPRTRRMARQHLATDEYAGNYGQRLYQYGVEKFHKRVEEKVAALREEQVERPLAKELCAICRGDASADGCRCELPAKFLPRISADGDGAGTLQMTSLPDDQGRRRILATRAGGDSEGAEPFWRRLTPKDSIEHSPGIAGDIKLS